MARYTGPTSKIARKFGEAIFGEDKSFERKNYPLNPILPAEDHEITSPFLFVNEMIILLKDATICASPVDSTTTLRFFATLLFVFAIALNMLYFIRQLRIT